MSGTDTEDLAGLYVLGALNAEEMRAVRDEAERSAAMAAQIVAWERRLTPLVALVPEAAVPATLWPQLSARLDRIAASGQSVGESYIPPLRQRRARRGEGRAMAAWRGAAVGAMALAAGLAAILITRLPPPPPQLAMIMPAQPGLGGWLISISANGVIHATAQGALSHTLQQDFQLWSLADGASTPVPLGLLPVTNAVLLKPATLPRHKFQLLVSLEPKGGSPTGLPTGPVMFSSQPVDR
jgi:anti-sigma-K factor RskA